MECHTDRRLIHGQRRQSFSRSGVAQRVRNIERVNPSDAYDVTGFRRFHLDSLESVIAHDLEDFSISGTRITINNRHLGIWRQLATSDSSDPNDANIAVVIES